ncbi:MAG: hypothetical protein ACR2OA_14510 [Rubripirellula sp.]
MRSTNFILPKNIWLEFMLGRHIHQESGIHYLLTFHALVILVFATSFAHATDIIPTQAQTKLLRGVSSQKNGIRYVQGSKGHAPDDTHGPMTYYAVPFRGGTFSLAWKVDAEQTVVLVFDSKPNGKATHALKVFINGAPGKIDHSDSLTLITYDDSTTQKKKAKITRHKYHVDAGQWHTASVTFSSNEATVTIDGKTFTSTSERFRDPIETCGVMHQVGTLETKNIKITQ